MTNNMKAIFDQCEKDCSGVICVRVSSGETVIGLLQDSSNDHEIVIRKPLVFINQGQQFGFAAYLPVAERDDVVILFSQVVAMSKIREDILDAYLESVGEKTIAKADQKTVKLVSGNGGPLR